ncbi:XAC2610-related protein [Ruminiclostridium cellobioparum]|uniref:XAC2610-related protein n=1 Tax=Ruminiclostridium cellobioparum TaxID=29355 RepID=UPI0028A74DCB|nr:hypothetical protein [Ruminiclostridium cellobioparum]
MKKIYLGIIVIFILTLVGCGKTAIQQRHDQSGDPSDSPTVAENVGTSNVVKNYSDENHKVIEIGKLSVKLDTYHIVSETYNGSSYAIRYKEDKSPSDNNSPVDTIIIREMKNLNLMDKKSIKSYLINMMPSFEDIKIYNNITDDSGVTYLSTISGGGKFYCIVNFGNISYLIDSNLRAIEYYIFNTLQNIAYEEIKQNVECANSFSASIHEIIDYETETVKYDMTQGKNGKKYSAELSSGGDGRCNYTLKNDKDKNILNMTSGMGELSEVIRFIDVNLDGYADIQVLDQSGAMNSLYNLYIWDESVNNFVKVKCDADISYFEVNEGCLVTWQRSGADSGNQTVLAWKDNKTLVKVSEEEYHACDDLSDSDTIAKIKYTDDLCTDNENVLFSFKIADSAKTLSVCQSKTKPAFIVYRFGSKDKIELEFPENKADSWSKFTYSYYLRGGGADNEGMDLNYLSFESGGYKYKIYQEFTVEDNMTNVGIKITDKATNKETDIKGLSNSIEGSLINLREDKRIKIEIL